MFSMVDTQFYPRQPALIASKKVQKKKRNWNSETKQDGTQDGKQQKIQVSNSSEDRETDLINKEIWRKIKKNGTKYKNLIGT